MLYTKGKYIVGEVKSSNSLDCISAVLFNEGIGHADLAPAFSSISSAGFFYLDKEGKVQVYGKSVSLKVESHSGDALWVERTLAITPQD